MAAVRAADWEARVLFWLSERRRRRLGLKRRLRMGGRPRPWEEVQIFNAAADVLSMRDFSALSNRYMLVMLDEPRMPDDFAEDEAWEGKDDGGF